MSDLAWLQPFSTRQVDDDWFAILEKLTAMNA